MSSVNWTRGAAAHLLRRAGFGGTPAEVDAGFGLGLEAAVDRLIDYESIDNSPLESRLASAGFNLQSVRGLQQWFLTRMAFSARPLEEKMTYFWNLHWTSAIGKVKSATLLYKQNQTERQLATAPFDEMVVAISKDPAMLVWLDNWLNLPARPNENYARELMELFTLGIGNYTQTDVTQIARALTGWTVTGWNKDNSYDASFLDNEKLHDNGVKTILGQTGPWTQLDAIDIILKLADGAGSVSGRFIGDKLWRFFAYDSPPDWIVSELSGVYASSGRSIKEVLRHLFKMPEFYAGHTYSRWVRTPAEYAVASVRMLEAESDFAAATSALAGMGQVLFNPDDAKGWNWGTSWINTGTVFARASLSNRLCANRSAEGTYLDPAGLLAGQNVATADAAVAVIADRLGVSDAAPDTVAAWVAYMNANDDGTRGVWRPDEVGIDKQVRGLVHLMLTSPDFQLA
jgi:uncharacterized protein (DUF1800 family)